MHSPEPHSPEDAEADFPVGVHVGVKSHGPFPCGHEANPRGYEGVSGREAEDKMEEASLIGRVKRSRYKDVDLL